MTILGIDLEKSAERGELVFVEVVGGGGSAPDATAAVKGILRLTGDLGGTADAPTVPGLAGKAAASHTHPTAEVVGLDAYLANLSTIFAPLAHSHTQAEVTGLTADLALLAPKASPALTGVPTVPTAAPGTNSTQAASTAFVSAAVASLIASAPGLLDTLDEIAAALNDDPAFAATMTTALALKAPLASPAFTGNPTAPTPATGDNDTSVATTGFVKAQAYAPLASPVFTGDPTAPTPATSDNDVSVATTAFVRAAITAYAPGGGGGAGFGMIPKSGQYLIPLASAAWTTSGAAYGSGNQPLVPIIVPIAMTIDELACRIATSEAGIGLRVSLYASDADGHPDALVATGAAASGSAGLHSVSFSPVALTPGVYWGAVRSDSGSTLRIWALASQSIVSFAGVGAGGEQRNPLPIGDPGAYATPNSTFAISSYGVLASNDVPYVAIGRA